MNEVAIMAKNYNGETKIFWHTPISTDEWRKPGPPVEGVVWFGCIPCVKRNPDGSAKEMMRK